MLPENILFSVNPSEDLAKFIQTRGYTRAVALVDENTKKDCLPLLQGIQFDQVIEVASGEEEKTLRTCEAIWDRMTQRELDRHALMVIIGGGVLGDMGGFCSATYKRGIDFVLVPTTLLAQVDASIGGKLGVDFKNFKNHIGVFQQPALTLLYSGFLKTLPLPELRSGFAEVIKHCLISDRQMWKTISAKPLEKQDWQTLMKHSVEFKARVTTEDPKEKGLRKILNAGHTIGHAVESYLLASGARILHGEAIAIGLIAEAYLAKEKNLLKEEDLRDISTYILDVFGKVKLNLEQADAIANFTLQDKKNKGNRILSVLLDGIGKAVWDCEITTAEVKGALGYYNNLQM